MKSNIVYKTAFLLATIDLWLATICALSGDVYFVYFMVLAGLMGAYGLYFCTKAEKEGE